PGILNWAVGGCLDWQRTGLCEPEEVKAATDAYRAEQDTVGGFVAECCFVHAQVKVKASALFEAYVAWSGDKVMTQKEFAKRLRGLNFDAKRTNSGIFYEGVGLNAVASV